MMKQPYLKEYSDSKGNYKNEPANSMHITGTRPSACPGEKYPVKAGANNPQTVEKQPDNAIMQDFFGAFNY
jgi:hypothetical protein